MTTHIKHKGPKTANTKLHNNKCDTWKVQNLYVLSQLHNTQEQEEMRDVNLPLFPFTVWIHREKQRKTSYNNQRFNSSDSFLLWLYWRNKSFSFDLLKVIRKRTSHICFVEQVLKKDTAQAAITRFIRFIQIHNWPLNLKNPISRVHPHLHISFPELFQGFSRNVLHNLYVIMFIFFFFPFTFVNLWLV